MFLCDFLILSSYMIRRKPIVALIYDFDGTLSPGNMQEFGFIQAINKDPDEFWKKNYQLSRANDANNILCYMYLMLNAAKENNISLQREQFRKFGSSIELYPGVKDWFALINAYGDEIGLEVRHYINSSGLREMIEGTSIAGEFTNIFASSYLYDEQGNAYWPGVAVDYIAKTQFIYKINKGINEVSDNVKINQYMPDHLRPIPFDHMIYFGDGETDIPCMKMVKNYGGHSIAVHDKKRHETALKLIRENRVNFACRADFRCGKPVHSVVKRILDKIKADDEFNRLLQLHKRKAEKASQR